MPPKSAPSKEKVHEEEILQAVILADSFNERFKPLTISKPRCLLPVCNAQLLDWTFESLAIAGVQEIFVVCRSHTELIKEAIAESKWSRPSSGLKIVPIAIASNAYSVGDALRHLDTQQIITSDFVLVSGDVVSNIRIDEVVRQHKERRKVSKEAIMTIVVKEAGAEHRTRPRGDTSLFVLDANTSECLHYEGVPGSPAKRSATIPREILEKHPEVEIRNDLIDCSIDVCSVDVPLLFQENFDYDDLRRDFVHGVLTSDLLDKTIFCHVAKKGYAARVKDTKSYGAVSKDILSRWTFPLVPDDNHPGGHTYEHVRGNKYFAKEGVVLSRSCKIGNNTLIGKDSKIHDQVDISASILGQGCIVARAAKIRDSYLWDEVCVEPRCVIDESIIASNVRILEGSVVRKGCLIAEGVTVGPNADLPEFTKVVRRSDVSDDEGTEDLVATTILGSNTNARIWVGEDGEGAEETDEEEEEDPFEGPSNLRLLRLGDYSPASDYSDTETEISSSASSSGSAPGSPTSFTSLSTAAGSIPFLSLSAKDEFSSEAKASLERAFAEGHKVEDAAIELKTLRMSNNVPIERVKETVIAFLVRSIGTGEGEERSVVGERVKRVWQRWGALIKTAGGGDQKETLSMLQAFCAATEYHPLFQQILVTMYNLDQVDEDDVQAWHNDPQSKGDGVGNMTKLWNVGGKFLEWLEAQSEEEETEEEEEDEEDEEDAVTKKADEKVGSKGKGKDDEDEDEDEDEEGDDEDEE